MEQANITPEPEEQPAAELRLWVTPTFERVPLDEALMGPGGPEFDMDGYHS
jgi:hypothetical protein